MSTIVTRAGKGSALTHAEVDANFVNLNNDKIEKSGTDPVVISVSSSSDALRITQTGTGKALLVEDSTNPDSTPFVIDASGNVIKGATTAFTSASALTAGIQAQSTGVSASSLGLYSFNTTANQAGRVDMGRTRGALGAYDIVQSGDQLGVLRFTGGDGTQMVSAAEIRADVDGTPGTNDMPGRLVFSTTADGASTPTERMRINSSGTVSISGALTASADSSFTSTGALLISKGTTGQQPGSPATGMIRYNTTTSQFEGYSGSTPAWKSIGGSALSNDTSTASTLYPVFAGATTGTAENLYTSNAKLLYKPSTGELSASIPRASNGIFVNTATVSTSYTVATGDNAMSAGVITIANGVTVTVSDGSRWTVV